MLIEIAVGDACGASTEYADVNIEQALKFEGYAQHPTHGLKPGQYTDDTQMSIAIAEALVDQIPWTREALADKFVACFKRDWRDGYSRHFQKLLEEVKDGTELLVRIDPTSDKSGGAMRAGPIGVLATPAAVRGHATVQASITHNTPDGIAAAQAAALMSHYFLYGYGSKNDLGEFLNQFVSVEGSSIKDWNEAWTGRILSKGWMSVRAAVTAIQRADSLTDVLTSCISFTGDTDTACAIAMAAASCCSSIEKNLPDMLIYRLEEGKFGRSYLAQLDEKLLALIS